MRKIFSRGCEVGYQVILIICLIFTVVLIHLPVYDSGQEEINNHVQEIYKKIQTETGQAQDALPLVIIDSNMDNAYNDGTEVVIYTGLINHAQSWDEIALVLGHETAHGMLYHLRMHLELLTKDQISVLEANADKMGAVYMMKAGYNVCKGREIFKYWKERDGNALEQNHPDFSYRYDELDINCD